MSRYVACEYICEKICAVSSSAGLPFRGGLATAQRPDGLEVTPTPAGILSPLYKYLYHLKNNPEALACSIHVRVSWVNRNLCFSVILPVILGD